MILTILNEFQQKRNQLNLDSAAAREDLAKYIDEELDSDSIKGTFNEQQLTFFTNIDDPGNK